MSERTGDSFEDTEKHYYVFNQLVKDEDDFVGYVAYTLYKQNKVAHITQIKKEKGKPPSDEELRDWQKNECTEIRLKNYRDLAEQKTNSFINQLRNKKEEDLRKRQANLDSKEQEIKRCERAIKEGRKELEKREKFCHVKVKGAFWSGVLQSLLASFVFLVFCFLLLLYLKGHTDIIGWLLNQ